MHCELSCELSVWTNETKIVTFLKFFVSQMKIFALNSHKNQLDEVSQYTMYSKRLKVLCDFRYIGLNEVSNLNLDVHLLISSKLLLETKYLLFTLLDLLQRFECRLET